MKQRRGVGTGRTIARCDGSPRNVAGDLGATLSIGSSRAPDARGSELARQLVVLERPGGTGRRGSAARRTRAGCRGAPPGRRRARNAAGASAWPDRSRRPTPGAGAWPAPARSVAGRPCRRRRQAATPCGRPRTGGRPRTRSGSGALGTARSESGECVRDGVNGRVHGPSRVRCWCVTNEPVVPGGGAMSPAAWESTKDRSGGGLGAAVRVEDALPNRVLRAGVPVGGTEQREAAAFSVHGVLPSRKRHVSPSIATFPHREADQDAVR